MANENGYNGWTNYPTWAIALWINNSEGDQEYITELVNEQENTFRAADALKDWTEEAMEMWQEGKGDAGMFGDLLTWAIGQTDWVELAESFWDADQHATEDAEE